MLEVSQPTKEVRTWVTKQSKNMVGVNLSTASKKRQSFSPSTQSSKPDDDVSQQRTSTLELGRCIFYKKLAPARVRALSV